MTKKLKMQQSRSGWLIHNVMKVVSVAIALIADIFVLAAIIDCLINYYKDILFQGMSLTPLIEPSPRKERVESLNIPLSILI